MLSLLYFTIYTAHFHHVCFCLCGVTVNYKYKQGHRVFRLSGRTVPQTFRARNLKSIFSAIQVGTVR